MPNRAHGACPNAGKKGFSLLEVLVATALVGLLLVVLLQILSVIFRTEEGIWKNNQALLVAERVVQERSGASNLAAGVSGPAGVLQFRCSLIQVVVSWQERRQPKRLVLETARTAALKNP